VNSFAYSGGDTLDKDNVQSSKKSFYIPALDGIRALAFILVLTSHSGLGEIVPGGLGVTIFFFLSGYLITTLLRLEVAEKGKISLSKFYLHRCRRILPPIYITLALAVMLAKVGIIAEGGSFKGICSVVFYYFNYSELLGNTHLVPTGLNVVWSLMIEEHFYFVFPLLYCLFYSLRVKKEMQWKVLTATCFATLLWRIVLVVYLHSNTVGLPRWTYSASDARFDSILWGCIMAIACNPWFNDSVALLKPFKGTMALFGFLLLLLSLVIRDPLFREIFRYSLQGIALFPIFYYCISTRSRWTAWLEWAPLRQVGQLSYSMYLIHFMIIGTLPLYLHIKWFPILIISFTLALLYALIMRKFVERPLKKLI